MWPRPSRTCGRPLTGRVLDLSNPPAWVREPGDIGVVRVERREQVELFRDAAVEIFYRRVLTDDLLAPYFDDVEMERQIAKQKAFLTMAFGGPHRYEGRDLRSAHAGLVSAGIGDAHFDAVVGHLADTLHDLGVADELVAEVAGIAEAARAHVLGR